MRELSIDEEKKIGLQTLLFFDEICKRNNLTYYLGYGSLLGAIRHKGFIPWDDDVDVIMLQKDYLKFHKIIKEEIKNHHYTVISSLDGTYPFSFTKLIDTNTYIKNDRMIDIKNMGLGIDIFPFSYLGNNLEEIYERKNKMSKVENLIRFSLYNNSKEIEGRRSRVVNTFIYIIAKSIGWRQLQKIYTHMENKHIYADKTEYCGMLSKMSKGIEPVFSSKIFDDICDVEFEGYNLPAPTGYDEFLRTVYNNYMVFPPESERASHSNKAYINE